MFWNKLEVVVAQHFKYTKYHWVAYLLMVKMVNFMLCELYHKLKKKDTVRCGECYEEIWAGCCKREIGMELIENE